MAIKSQPKTKVIHGAKNEGDVVVLTSPSSLLEKVGLGVSPTDFGLPDLLEPGLSVDEQDRRLRELRRAATCSSTRTAASCRSS